MLQLTSTISVISKCGTFSQYLFLAILFSMRPSNFNVSGVKSSREYAVLILNVILFSVFYIYFY